MNIKPIRIPRSVIRDIPPPITNSTPPPVTNDIQVPVIDVPTPVIEYPVIDVPTRETFEELLQSGREQEEVKPETVRELPPPKPPAAISVDVPGVGPVDLPPVAPLITAGATAVVTTTVVLVSNIAINQLKQILDAPLKRLLEPKKSKIKIKQKKPVLHFVMNEGRVSIFEYSVLGTKLISTVDKPEQYIRDQIELSSVYEYDNVILIDENIKELFTKEGQKRFKKHFCPSKSIVKKLSARISI